MAFPPNPTGQLASGQLLQQRYRIVREVGQGGMGAVYKAKDTRFGNRLVAIKEMSQSKLAPQKVPGAVEQFKKEALTLAGLKHPSLPSIYDHFSATGRWYLVMDFIEGETLEEHLDIDPSSGEEKTLPVPEALDIGIQLSKVLGYLHTRPTPIIFRDLKPSNIMLTPDGSVYLIDFGIARHFKPGQAKDTAVAGTDGYAPPEQYGKAQTTERSDIYSLGATLYQVLSGYDPSQSPFRFPPLQSLVPTLPKRLVELITRMVEMDASKRPTNMAAVKQELERIADQHRPPPVPPASPATPAPPSPNAVRVKTPQKILRTLVVLVILLIGLSAGWIFGIRPVFHGIAQDELDAAMTNAAKGIPQQSRFIGSIPVSIKEDTITTLASKLAPSTPVQNLVAHITPNNVRLDLQLYGLPCDISLVPQVDNARLVISNVKIEGIASLIMSSDEMTALLNNYLQQHLQYSVSNVQLKDHEMDLTVNGQ